MRPYPAAPGQQPINVVFIEDDAKLGRLTAKYLESHGLVVALYDDPGDGLASIFREPPDVVLLDVMLPGMDGFEVCRRIRQRLATPVVMVTARGEEADRVMGLEGGADDYIAKPFSSRELLARIRAQARRGRGRAGPSAASMTAGSISVEPGSRTAKAGGTLLNLTTYEFDLLCVFVERAGQVLTREQLVEAVRGSAEEAFDRSIDVHVSHLRKKLGDSPRQPRLLKTVRGVGYVLATDEP